MRIGIGAKTETETETERQVDERIGAVAADGFFGGIADQREQQLQIGLAASGVREG